MNRLSSKERKKQIIESAMVLFAKNGFNGTHTKDIAKNAKVSEALIFKFFPTKLSLYSAIIEYRLQQVGSTFDISEKSCKTIKDFLCKVALSHIRKIEEDDTFMRILLFSALEGHKLSKIFFDTKITHYTMRLVDYMKNKIKEGIFKNINPLLLARVFMGMIYHYLLLKKIFEINASELPDSKKYVETIVDIFLDGVKKKK
ncbi:MAG: TetR/AcrR family transcriptional regulator [Planctomycetota bacterium]